MNAPFQEAARSAKSTTLLILLHRAGITAELAQRMNEADWRTVAKAAQVRKPSPETRRIVLDHMRELETPLSAA